MGEKKSRQKIGVIAGMVCWLVAVPAWADMPSAGATRFMPLRADDKPAEKPARFIPLRQAKKTYLLQPRPAAMARPASPAAPLSAPLVKETAPPLAVSAKKPPSAAGSAMSEEEASLLLSIFPATR